MIAVSAAIGWSFNRAPPPLISLRASLRLPARVRLVEQFEGGDTGLELCALDVDGWQRLALGAFLEGAARGLGSLLGGTPTVGEGSDLGRQHLLGLVDLLAFQCLELCDFRQRHLGEALQEAADIGVLGIAPVLPELVGAEACRVEPYGARRGLAHLGAGRGGEQRRGEREQLRAVDPAAEVSAHDDVAPLVRAAHLRDAVVAAMQFQEVIGLQDHVIELEEGERLVAIEAQLHRVHGEHAVDREMPANVAQQRNVLEIVQPVGVIGHERVLRAAAEGQVIGEAFLDALHVGVDRLCREQLARLVAAGGVTHLGRAGTHQGDRLVSCLLPPAQQHDLQQMADMQGVGGAVEADIGGTGAGAQQLIEARGIAALMHHAALVHDPHEIRLERSHLAARRCLKRLSPEGRRV